MYNEGDCPLNLCDTKFVCMDFQNTSKRSYLLFEYFLIVKHFLMKHLFIEFINQNQKNFFLKKMTKLMNEVCKKNQRHINGTIISYIFNYYVDVAITAFVEHVLYCSKLQVLTF